MKNEYTVRAYRDLPNNRFDEAVRFLKIQISAYTAVPMLEG